MESLTGREIWERQEALERDAASLLGQVLFEFGRLEVTLGLCLVWVGNGQQLESRTKRFEAAGFNAKLEALEQEVDRALPKGSKRHIAYSSWIERAHSLREIRNQLAHGRWGFDALARQAVNVAGLPTSSVQPEARYTIEELAAVVESLRILAADLDYLRQRWRL